MLRRWRQELANHSYGPGFGGIYPYCSMAPPSLAVGISCHCARGKGTMRKQRPFGGDPWSGSYKKFERKRVRREKYAAIDEQLHD